MSAQQFRSSRILFEKENQDLNRLNAKHHLTTPSSSSPFKGSDTEGETEPSPSPSPFIPRFERFDTFDISPSKTLAPSPPPSSSSNTFSNSHSSSNSPSNSPLSCVKSLFFTKETPVSPKKQRGGGARGRVDKRKSWGSLNGQVPNQNRYETEFKQIRLLGTGAFGEVYQCENRIDGCTYAIKKSKRPITGKLDEKSALREVHAHATLSSLGVHENIVRYYSVWKENNYLYLQNEFCNGGGITRQDYDESQLLDIMKQIASGLKFLHDRGFVHLDIKPGNIFICTIAPPKSQKNEGNDKPKDQILYKIGDFGHVRSFGGQGGEKHTSEDGSVKIQEDDDESSEIDLEEGDCCYIAREILSFDKQFDQQQLPAADIFSLAISIYELASKESLPQNGDEWGALRSGKVPDLPNLSKEFNELLKKMMAPEATSRPSIDEVLSHPLLSDEQPIQELREELKKEKEKSESLQRLLKRTGEPEFYGQRKKPFLRSQSTIN